MKVVRLVVAAVLALAGPAAAQIHSSGPWGVAYTGAFSGYLIMHFVQSGTSLTVGGQQGSIDPATGAFSVSDTGACPGRTDGVVNATSTQFGGIAHVGLIHGGGCGYVDLTLDGRRCGNGVLDPGEVCDDGNRAVGDCCSPDCQFALPEGSACGNPNQCAPGTCTASGSCQTTPLPDGTPCDDGLFCTGTDSCFSGVCAAHSGNPCGQDKPECARGCNESQHICADSQFQQCTSDGDPCTNDHCNGAGACVHTPIPAGQSCADDGLICTFDYCDASGACIHPPMPSTYPCGTLDTPCDIPGHCEGTTGECIKGRLPAGSRSAYCQPCESCDADGGCVAAPQSAPACRPARQPRGSTLALAHGSSDARDALRWGWHGTATLADFGAPDSGEDYAFCVYSLATPARLLASRVPAGGTCGARSCWTRTSRALKYRGPLMTPDGISSILLADGKVMLSGKGAALGLPASPLAFPVLVQLQAGTGGCWEAEFGDARTNTDRRVRATSP